MNNAGATLDELTSDWLGQLGESQSTLSRAVAEANLPDSARLFQQIGFVLNTARKKHQTGDYFLHTRTHCFAWVLTPIERLGCIYIPGIDIILGYRILRSQIRDLLSTCLVSATTRID